MEVLYKLCLIYKIIQFFDAIRIGHQDFVDLLYTGSVLLQLLDGFRIDSILLVFLKDQFLDVFICEI
jgi:hypothetical protein